MQVGEQTYVPMAVGQPPPKDEEKKKKKKRIKVRVSLYYDGTQNNRANTNVRKNVERGQAKGQSAADYEKSLDLFAEHGMSGSSYDNDESNVSRLEGQSLDKASGYDYYFTVYTEGIGTIDKDEDSLVGAMFGAFDTGIYPKVDAGIANALGKLSKGLPEGAIIEELALDTCGFSRGAAAARFAIHRALHDEKWGPSSLKTSLEGRGFTVEEIKVLAVCLFDSVSSYGLPFRHKSNVKKLKLDAIRHAKAVLQLAAAEEYRENFSLTTIESAKKNGGRNVYLPGAHSDVGGCYEDGLVEDKDVYAGSGSEDIAKFLLDRGWYSKRQLKHVDKPLVGGSVKVSRSGLLKEYSYIPLHIMADFAKEQGLQFKEDLEETFKLRTSKSPTAPAPIEAALLDEIMNLAQTTNGPNQRDAKTTAKKRSSTPPQAEPDPIPAALVEKIKSYAKTVTDSKPSDWEMPRDDLNKLRSGHLHIPFIDSIGLKLRVAKSGSFRNYTYRPYRLTYHDA